MSTRHIIVFLAVLVGLAGLAVLSGCEQKATAPETPAALADGALSIGQLHNEILTAFESRVDPDVPAAKDTPLRTRIEPAFLAAANEVVARHDLGAPLVASDLDDAFALLADVAEAELVDVRELSWNWDRLRSFLLARGMTDDETAVVTRFGQELMAAGRESEDAAFALIESWRRRNPADEKNALGVIPVMLDVAEHSLHHWTADSRARDSGIKKPTAHADAFIDLGDTLGAITGLVWGPLGSILGGAVLSIAFQLAEDECASTAPS